MHTVPSIGAMTIKLFGEFMNTPFWRYEEDIMDTDFYKDVISPWMDEAVVGDISPFMLPNGMKLKRDAESEITFCECCGPEVFEWVMVKPT